jgi:hypothetical protein
MAPWRKRVDALCSDRSVRKERESSSLSGATSGVSPPWSRGRVVRQGPAKPRTPVQIRARSLGTGALVGARPPVPLASQAPTHAAVAQLVEQRSPKPQGRGSSPRRRAGRPAELDRRRGYAAEWDGPHRTVNPDSWTAAGSIPAVPTVGPGRGFRSARRPEQRREVAQSEARRLREPEVAGSRPAFPTWGWVAQCGRASVSYSEGRGFEPRPKLCKLWPRKRMVALLWGSSSRWESACVACRRSRVRSPPSPRMAL